MEIILLNIGSILVGSSLGVICSLIPGFRPLSILWILGLVSNIGFVPYALGCVAGYFSALICNSVKEALLPGLSGSPFTLRHFELSIKNPKELIKEYIHHKIMGVFFGCTFGFLLMWVPTSPVFSVLTLGWILYISHASDKEYFKQIIWVVAGSMLFFWIVSALGISQPIYLLGNVVFLIPASLENLNRLRQGKKNKRESKKEDSLRTELDIDGSDFSILEGREHKRSAGELLRVSFAMVFSILAPGLSADTLVQASANGTFARVNVESKGFFLNAFTETVGVWSIIAASSNCFGKSVLGAEMCQGISAVSLSIHLVPVALVIGCLMGLLSLRWVTNQLEVFHSSRNRYRNNQKLEVINIVYLLITTIMFAIVPWDITRSFINIIVVGILVGFGWLVYQEWFSRDVRELDPEKESPLGAFLFMGPIVKGFL